MQELGRLNHHGLNGISASAGIFALLAERPEFPEPADPQNAHDFITRLPDGYDTVVGDRGTRLSGGKRQRIAIARALLKDAPILLLYEPISNLDTENERLIKAAVAKLMAGRTTLVIAHRLSTILSADRVVMIDHGRGVAVGTLAELLAQESAYAQLVATQRQGLDPHHQRPGRSSESVTT